MLWGLRRVLWPPEATCWRRGRCPSGWTPVGPGPPWTAGERDRGSHRTLEPDPASSSLQSVFRDGQPPGTAWPPPLPKFSPCSACYKWGQLQAKQPNPHGPPALFPLGTSQPFWNYDCAKHKVSRQPELLVPRPQGQLCLDPASPPAVPLSLHRMPGSGWPCGIPPQALRQSISGLACSAPLGLYWTFNLPQAASPHPRERVLDFPPPPSALELPCRRAWLSLL